MLRNYVQADDDEDQCSPVDLLKIQREGKNWKTNKNIKMYLKEIEKKKEMETGPER